MTIPRNISPNLVNQASACDFVDSAANANNFQFLTPDALMIYCENKLRNLDTQVQKAFSGQSMYNADQQSLSDLANSLGTIDHDLAFKDEDDFKKAWNTYQQMEGTASKLSDPAAKAALEKAAGQLHDKLQAAFAKMKSDKYTGDVDSMFAADGQKDSATKIDEFFTGKDGDGKDVDDDLKKHNDAPQTLSIQDWQGDSIEGAIKNCQTDINSSSELAMINLQSLMSQRQEAIQLCTNLVQSLGDQCNKIAQNVGH